MLCLPGIVLTLSVLPATFPPCSATFGCLCCLQAFVAPFFVLVDSWMDTGGAELTELSPNLAEEEAILLLDAHGDTENM